jgi:lauroyl/myristoyl acyltransferase
VSIKAELKGHEFDLDALVHLFPSGSIRVVRENGVYYLLADDIDNRPQGVPFYEVAPETLKTVNGLARVTDSAYQPVELSGY